MNPENKKYILENINKKSAQQISRELNIRERKIERFLRQYQSGDKKTASDNGLSKARQNKKVLFLSLLLIATLGFIVYANSLNGKFILDDDFLIKNNPFIKSLSGIKNCFTGDIGAGSGSLYAFYRPLQIVTYALDYAIWKLDVTGYHLTNMFLHILVALCIYWLINILYNNNILSFLTSALFVVHPIHTEAVSYISTRADCLAAFFTLLSFIVYKKQLSRDRVDMMSYIPVLLGYACALLSKESGFILPVLLLFYHFVFKKKVKPAVFLSMTGILAAYIVVRFTCLKLILPPAPSETVLDRLPGLFVAIASYLRLLAFPFSLRIEYGSKLFEFTDPRAIIGIIITLLSLAYAYIKRNNRIILFSIGWFFITLLPVSNLYRLNAYMSENWLYLPSIGFFVIIAYPLSLIYNNNRYRVWGISMIIASLLFYSALTIKQNDYWRDETIFYERTLKLVPDSARSYNNMGNRYSEKGDYDQAILYYNKAIELKPDYVEAYSNRGNNYDKKGNHDQAISDCTKAIELAPNYVDAYNNRGVAYDNKGSYDQAMSDYDKAVELNPGLALTYNNRGVLYYHKGNYDQAILDHTEAIELKSDYADAYNNRAIAYYYKQEYSKAWADVHKAESLGYRVNPQLLEALKKVVRP